MAVFAAENLDTDNFAAASIIHALRSIAYILGFFAEDSAQQAFLRTQLLLALWRNLTNQDITGAYFRTNLYDAVFVEVTQTVFRHIRDIAGDNLWAEFGLANFN